MRVQRGEIAARPSARVEDQSGLAREIDSSRDCEASAEDSVFADPRWTELANRFILATLKQRARQKPRHLSDFLQYAQDLYPEGEPWK